MDGIERDLRGQAEVIRLDILSGVGREVAARYGVPAIPTILILNRAGQVVYRQTGMPDRQDVVANASAP